MPSLALSCGRLLRLPVFGACALLPAVVGALQACQVFFPTTASEAGDGGSDGATKPDATRSDATKLRDARGGDAAAADFTLSVTPNPVNLRAEGSTSVTVTAVRKAGFNQPITIYSSVPPYVSVASGSTAIIAEGATTTSVTLSAPEAVIPPASLGDFPVTWTGQVSETQMTASAPLVVHLAGTLATFTGGTATPLAIPSNVHHVVIKAWGAGGGCGCGSAAYTGGGSVYQYVAGGAGGFAQADVLVHPSEALLITVGAGGVSCTGGFEYSSGAGGGGASSVAVGGANVLVAGGGGGGGASQTDEYSSFVSGYPGGGGGGPRGQNGGGPCDGGGLGGTQSYGWDASRGTYLQAGGGGGLHGGEPGCPPGMRAGGGGGGGGSGGSDGLDAGVVLSANLTADGGIPGTSDPDYLAPAGAPCTAFLASTLPTPLPVANNGRVVVIVP